MTTVLEIQSAIESLPDEKFRELRQWLSSKDWNEWDSQIENDSQSGKLNSLINEAILEKNSENFSEL